MDNTVRFLLTELKRVTSWPFSIGHNFGRVRSYFYVKYILWSLMYPLKRLPLFSHGQAQKPRFELPVKLVSQLGRWVPRQASFSRPIGRIRNKRGLACQVPPATHTVLNRDAGRWNGCLKRWYFYLSCSVVCFDSLILARLIAQEDLSLLIFFFFFDRLSVITVLNLYLTLLPLSTLNCAF